MPAPLAPVYAAWRNNTNASWWKDTGLRKMVLHIGMLYLCVFTFGYDGSLLNGLQTVPAWQKYFDHPTGNILGLISASFYFPKIVTPFLATILADRFGRRVAIATGSVLSVAGGLLNTFAQSRNELIGGRVLLGAGLGMQATIAPIFVQELCHPRMRAVAGGMYLTIFYVGSTLAAWLCFAMIHWTSTWAWRLPTIIQISGTASIGVYILTGCMAESPRWLVSVGREEQALRVLAGLHANGDVDDELVLHEMSEIRKAIEFDRTASRGYTAFLKTAGNRKRLFVIMIIAASGQLNGVGLVSYYLTSILKLIGISNTTQVAGINGGLAVWNLVTTLVFAQFVEKVGRRPMWLTGTSGLVLSFSIVTALSGSFAEHKKSQVGIAVIPFLFVFYFFYNMAWTVLANLYVAEIMPYSLRSKGMSVYVFTQSVSLAFNQYVNPVALNAIAWKYYLVYIAVQVLLVVFAYFFLIETKGYTIEEVSRLFDGRAAADHVVAETAADKHGDEHVEDLEKH